MSDDPTTPEEPFADALIAEHLFSIADAATPDPEFAAALRRRIEEAAGITSPTIQEAAMTSTTSTSHARSGYRPPGEHSLKPYLVVDGARAAVAWYQDVFGAIVTYEPIVMEDDRIGHVELTIDGTTFALADEFPEMDILGPLARGGSAVSLMLFVPDVDATYALAVERGAFGEREPADQFYGSRSGNIHDPFGHRWSIQTYLGDDGVGAPAPAGPTQAQDLWNEVGYYVINVPQLEPAMTFWSGLLGWEFAESREAHDTPGEYAHVESSTVPFGLHGGGDTTPTWQPYIRVRDLDAAVARVRELGGTVESVEHGYDSGGGAVCFDDQGTRFELWQPAEGY